MAEFEYKMRIRYTDIDENNELSDKGILSILSEVARKTLSISRLWTKRYRKNKHNMDVIILESKSI